VLTNPAAGYMRMHVYIYMHMPMRLSLSIVMVMVRRCSGTAARREDVYEFPKHDQNREFPSVRERERQ